MFSPIVKLKTPLACHSICSTPTLILYALQGKLRITNVLTTNSRKIVCQVVKMQTSLNDVVVLDDQFCTWHTVNDVALLNSFSFEVNQHDQLSVHHNNVLCYNNKELLLIREANENGHQYRLSLPNNFAYLHESTIYVATNNAIQLYDLDLQLKQSFPLPNVVAISKIGDILVSVQCEDKTTIVYAWDKFTFPNTEFLQLFTISNHIIVCCPDKLLFIHQDHVTKVDLPETLIMATHTIYNDELYLYLLFQSEIVRYEIQLSQIPSLSKIMVQVEQFDYLTLKPADTISEERANIFKTILKSQPSSKPSSKATSKNNSAVNLQKLKNEQKTPPPVKNDAITKELEDELMRKVQIQLQDQQSLQNAKYESFLKVVSQSLKQGLADSFDKFAKNQPQINTEEISAKIVKQVDAKIQKALKSLVVDAFVPKMEIIVDHMLKQVDKAVEERVVIAIERALAKQTKKPASKESTPKSKPQQPREQPSDIMQLLQSSKQHLIQDSDNDEDVLDLYKNGHFGLFIQQCINNGHDEELQSILHQDPDDIFNQISPMVCLHLLTWLFNNVNLNPNKIATWIRKGLLKINHRVLLLLT